MNPFKSLNHPLAFRKQRSNRIEELTDAVFAIVMTLLVLDIRLPDQEMKTEVAVWHSLKDLLPEILTFAFSFSVVGQLWTTFINQFNHIQDANRNETIIAVFCLLPVSLLPFSTSFLSVHMWSQVAIGFYIGNLLTILLMFTLHWLYAYRKGMVKAEGGQEKEIHKAIMSRSRLIFLGYVLVACFCLFSRQLAVIGMVSLHVLIIFSGFIEKVFDLFRGWIGASVMHNRRKQRRYLPRP